MAMSAHCGSCGTALRPTAKFCDQCGAARRESAEAAVYKQVTVLFADVVRSMDIAAALELERFREVMNALVGRSAEVVRRWGGGIVENTGDGVMAVFGAPIALEDHAFRACLAALDVQRQAGGLAEEVKRRDGVALALRVGLNSGRVIAGDIGSARLGYTTTGETVGFARRMESVAPTGGVMISESTARLVEGRGVLIAPAWVRIKGADDDIRAYRLLGISPPDPMMRRSEASLVGRRWEMAALGATLDRAIEGCGGVVNVVGPPGIGKSRLAREAAALAAGRGVEVRWAFCESHAREIPFGVISGLLRASLGVAGLDGDAARAQTRARLPNADPEDLLLLDDLLGIAEPATALPDIDADARRRRLTALISATALAGTEPRLLIIEDAHWIDPVSESMIADCLAVASATTAMVLITARPEYGGALLRADASQQIRLVPLGGADIKAMLGELLGSDPSVGALEAVIAHRADGNPFFAEEIVRELVQRGVLTGARGAYVCGTDVADLSVPATVQAAIEARIDRLGTPARQALYAASVIGARFGARLLVALGIDPAVEELLAVELIDRVRSEPDAEYAFRHPLIRSVAYESQLKSDRAAWHRRLAAAIEQTAPGSVEENAAVIAEHLRAAGDLHAAYSWHMRSAAWSIIRDVGAARSSWERAHRIADELPDADPARPAMRIAPRTMLSATDWFARSVQNTWGRFHELRELCDAVGDKVSLAIGMTGLATELLYAGRPGEGSQLASEQMALLDSIGNPRLTAGLSFGAFANWFNCGKFDEILRWSQTVIEQSADDPEMGAEFGIGSPLAVALTFRGIARSWLGRPGWAEDIGQSIAMARSSDPTTHALVVAWALLPQLYGALRHDASATRIVEEAAQTAAVCSNDFAVMGSEFALGAVLLFGDDVTDRRRGERLMVRARDEFLPARAPSLVPLARVLVAREGARRGDHDAAIPVMRDAVGELHRSQRRGWGLYATDVFVQTLLERGTNGDLSEARALIEDLPRQFGRGAIPDITCVKLSCLLARACGDDAEFLDLTTRHRAMAESLGFEGHRAWALAASAQPPG